MKIVSTEQMRAIEKAADAAGLSYQEMMNRAGWGAAQWLLNNLDLSAGVVGLVGSGNNGGDALVALSHLARRGIRTCGMLVKPRPEDPLIARYLAYGGAVLDFDNKQHSADLQALLLPGTVVLDGILGTGLTLPLRASFSSRMAEIRRLMTHRSDVLVVAIDCPSGVDCDSGEAASETLPATHTLVMAAIKQGLLRHPARALAGQFHQVEIGVADLEKPLRTTLPTMIEAASATSMLPHRPADGHKGAFGTCLVIAGSRPYTGAAFLSGKAAYRAGCGLVNIATLSEVRQALAGPLPEAVWTVLPGEGERYDPDGVHLLDAPLSKADSLVIGPGWGVNDENLSFLDRLLTILPDGLPVIVDADGLKLLARLGTWWKRLPKHAILTPHPGEMSVLTGLTITEIQADRWGIAQRFARAWDATVLLKGALTVVSTPGGALWVNPTSSASLATAGSGDVLAGMVGGLLAQGAPTEAAAVAAVWWHSQAGVQGTIHIGSERSVTALDVLDCLGPALIK